MLIAILGTALLAASALQEPSPQVADTARPVMPDSAPLPAPTVTVVRPGSPPGVLYYRDLIGIRFDDSTSGKTVRRVLSQYQATIVGGMPWVDEYIVRIPDPGATWSAYDALLTRLENEPGIDYVAGVTARSVFRIKTRPADADTSRPAAPYDRAINAGDSTIVVSPPSKPGEVVPQYSRTVFFLRFLPEATGLAVREVLARYRARIVGGTRGGEYVIEVPDPGVTYEAYRAFLDILNAEPTVDFAAPYESRPVITVDSCNPTLSPSDDA